MNCYRIIFPRGDKTQIDVAYVIDYEVDEWDLASRKEFMSITEASYYAENLANEHGLKFVKASHHNYLD